MRTLIIGLSLLILQAKAYDTQTVSISITKIKPEVEINPILTQIEYFGGDDLCEMLSEKLKGLQLQFHSPQGLSSSCSEFQKLIKDQYVLHSQKSIKRPVALIVLGPP